MSTQTRTPEWEAFLARAVMPAPPQHGTFCSCGIWSCDRMGVYCDALVSSDGAPQRSDLGAEMLAAFDAMAERHRAVARARAEGERVVGGDTLSQTQGGAEVAKRLRHERGKLPRNAVADSPNSAPRPQCAENVGTGTKIHQCTYDAKPGTSYCGRHQKANVSESFEEEPNLPDTEDSFAW